MGSLSYREMVEHALASFEEARRVIERTFGASSASDIVAKVLRGEMPRNGLCDNGLEYMVHGVGYTVVLTSGAQVHIDSGGDSDCFTLYDLRFYLQDAETGNAPSVADLAEVCEVLSRAGRLRRVDEIGFELGR